MARIIFFLVIIGTCWWMYRRFRRDAERLAERSKQQRKERQTGAIGTLIKDPVTGEYRVKRDGE